MSLTAAVRTCGTIFSSGWVGSVLAQPDVSPTVEAPKTHAAHKNAPATRVPTEGEDAARGENSRGKTVMARGAGSGVGLV